MRLLIKIKNRLLCLWVLVCLLVLSFCFYLLSFHPLWQTLKTLVMDGFKLSSSLADTWSAPISHVPDRAETVPATVTPMLAELQITDSQIAATPVVEQLPEKKITPVVSINAALQEAAWGEAVKISDTGYSIKLAEDVRMGTPREIYQALNWYRYVKGKSNLTWSDSLAKYAQQRANFICENGSDSHVGFEIYVKKEEGYKQLGFYRLGENMSTYLRLEATHLIEWMYAASPTHNANQLDDWSHVGIGVADDCSTLIFGNLMI